MKPKYRPKPISPLGWVIICVLTFWVIVLWWFCNADASPFLICDAQAGVSYYTVTGDSFAGFSGNIAAQTDGSIKVDLAGITKGSHSIAVTACSELWGCSTSSPFTFMSASPASPGALRITK